MMNQCSIHTSTTNQCYRTVHNPIQIECVFLCVHQDKLQKRAASQQQQNVHCQPESVYTPDVQVETSKEKKKKKFVDDKKKNESLVHPVPYSNKLCIRI